MNTIVKITKCSDEEKTAALKLCDLQEELRRRIIKQKLNGKPRFGVLQSPGGAFNDFLEGRRALLSGTLFTQACAYADRTDLIDAIAGITGVQGQARKACCHPRNLVALAYALHALRQHPLFANVRSAIFSATVSIWATDATEMQKTIDHLLAWEAQGFFALQNADTARELNELVCMEPATLAAELKPTPEWTVAHTAIHAVVKKLNGTGMATARIASEVLKMDRASLYNILNNDGVHGNPPTISWMNRLVVDAEKYLEDIARPTSPKKKIPVKRIMPAKVAPPPAPHGKEDASEQFRLGPTGTEDLIVTGTCAAMRLLSQFLHLRKSPLSPMNRDRCLTILYELVHVCGIKPEDLEKILRGPTAEESRLALKMLAGHLAQPPRQKENGRGRK